MSKTIRLALGVVIVANLVVSLLGLIGALQRGDVKSAATAGLAIVTGLGVWWALTWGRIWAVVLVVVIASLGFGVLNGRGWIGVGVALSIVFLAGWHQGRELVGIDSVKPAEGIDPGAKAAFDAFRSMGYSPAGTVSFEVARSKIVRANLLIGPTGDRYAVVTDLVLVINSTFGPRTLVSRSSAHMRPPPDALVNDLQGANARELERSHEKALGVLAEREIIPDQVEAESLISAHIERERHWIASTGSKSSQRLAASLRSGAGEGPLDRSTTAGSRIDAWLGNRRPV